MRRIVLGDWDESDEAEVVQLEAGEILLVEALPPKPAAPNGRLVKVSLYGRSGQLLVDYNVPHPTNLRAEFDAVEVCGMTVEWVS